MSWAAILNEQPVNLKKKLDKAYEEYLQETKVEEK